MRSRAARQSPSSARCGRPANQTTSQRQMVYRITGDGAIQDQFALDLQTGSSAPDEATQAFLLALGLPAPAILFAIGLLLVIATDPPQSYPAAVTALLKDSGPRLIAVLALSIVLAILVQRRSRAFGLSRREQIAWSVFVLLFGLPAYVGFRLIAAGRSGSLVRIATLRLPATVWRARSAECAFRILP